MKVTITKNNQRRADKDHDKEGLMWYFCCPLAQALMKIYPGSKPRVTLEYIQLGISDPIYHTPKVKEFIDRVDVDDMEMHYPVVLDIPGLPEPGR